MPKAIKAEKVTTQYRSHCAVPSLCWHPITRRDEHATRPAPERDTPPFSLRQYSFCLSYGTTLHITRRPLSMLTHTPARETSTKTPTAFTPSPSLPPSLPQAGLCLQSPRKPRHLSSALFAPLSLPPRSKIALSSPDHAFPPVALAPLACRPLRSYLSSSSSFIPQAAWQAVPSPLDHSPRVIVCLLP
jgi:hypothetical protein